MTTPKSTGKTDRKETEFIAAKWLVQGTIPERTNAKNHSTQNIDSHNLVNQLKTMDLTKKNISKIVDALLLRHRMANLTAMFTGMRIGEVQALQLQDIGMDRIYVRHNWAGADGLKVPKNGDTREIPIPVELRDMLLAQANKNPYGRGLGGFVFFGLLPDAPIDNRVWLAALHEVMESLGIPNQRKISFNCWRHLYTARMAGCRCGTKITAGDRT